MQQQSRPDDYVYVSSKTGVYSMAATLFAIFTRHAHAPYAADLSQLSQVGGGA